MAEGTLPQVLSAARRLNLEQRAAGVGALLLIVSTFGPFSFVEAAEVVLGAAILALLYQRAEEKRFHLPFGDGTVIMVAGCWAAGLICVRLFDRPLGQNLLALACAAILILAGLRESARRPPDDVPVEREDSAVAKGGAPDPPQGTPAAGTPQEGTHPDRRASGRG